MAENNLREPLERDYNNLKCMHYDVYQGDTLLPRQDGSNKVQGIVMQLSSISLVWFFILHFSFIMSFYTAGSSCF